VGGAKVCATALPGESAAPMIAADAGQAVARPHTCAATGVRGSIGQSAVPGGGTAAESAGMAADYGELAAAAESAAPAAAGAGAAGGVTAPTERLVGAADITMAEQEACAGAGARAAEAADPAPEPCSAGSSCQGGESPPAVADVEQEEQQGGEMAGATPGRPSSHVTGVLRNAYCTAHLVQRHVHKQRAVSVLQSGGVQLQSSPLLASPWKGRARTSC
jgi:hypothetical protein